MIKNVALFFKNIIDWANNERSIFSYLVEALKVTNNNIILATPLILSFFLLSSYLMFMPVAGNPQAFVFILIVFFAMSAVFLSGWLYIISKAVDAHVGADGEDVFIKEDSNEAISLLKIFPTGVGKHFVSFFLMIMLFFVMLTGLIIVTYKTGLMFIGSIGISRADLLLALSSQDAMRTLITSMSFEQQLKLNYWNLYFLLTTTMFSYLLMLWAPEIIYSGRNVLETLLSSIIKLFKRFFKSFGFFVFISALYFVITLLSAIFKSPILQFIMTVLYFYFLVYSSVLIFLFYRKEFKGSDR